MESIGRLDVDAVEKEISNSVNEKRGKYTVYTPKERFIIAEYAKENGASRAAKYFKKKHPGINESTVRGFVSKYDKELIAAEIEDRQPFNLIVSQPRGRPRMLGPIDDMVQRYLRVSTILFFKQELLQKSL